MNGHSLTSMREMFMWFGWILYQSVHMRYARLPSNNMFISMYWYIMNTK